MVLWCQMASPAVQQGEVTLTGQLDTFPAIFTVDVLLIRGRRGSPADDVHDMWRFVAEGHTSGTVLDKAPAQYIISMLNLLAGYLLGFVSKSN